MSKAQCTDIKRYLEKEIGILDDLIAKASTRQKAENSRFYKQVGEVRELSHEIDRDRQACLKEIAKIERHLGVHTEPMEVEAKKISFANGFATVQ